MSKKTPPIGFGRKPDPDPNGTGDGFRLGVNYADLEAESAPEKPKRLPKVVPAYVGQMEGLDILAAYDIFPLAPLSNIEQQLLQIVAALELEADKFRPSLSSE
ncbi:hypothetical protein [Hymenobacter algoricola]|uniref:Uncharacterized protein n=1 Tax=Hymenobacter algoricola TaxID=486267 RepID=A0ABP7NTW3_9BACT